ncbi:uncharacterized protein L969DRAFT_53961 [Mixia osmundae IAM 14324]|uniref:Uncharacterized protein n=1 Tax=Mixia osmundae (strain CBS 9802 / IAM 14324 / JCM 22182 / KY 12970) TaxID=764103 RepID=G7E2Q1_MIXOS|nr:uncharacterized protein L969DRAFT_53961 [Mixia osmundae IAM 14324]KEI36976.1 hypothetical protein L969DRAFT_53961 [Mixia osmundae IAM 14324]GAA97111.1 hypothetical protein E5Q_03786 [Mixia osmundae IAM 14324]
MRSVLTHDAASSVHWHTLHKRLANLELLVRSTITPGTGSHACLSFSHQAHGFARRSLAIPVSALRQWQLDQPAKPHAAAAKAMAFVPAERRPSLRRQAPYAPHRPALSSEMYLNRAVLYLKPLAVVHSVLDPRRVHSDQPTQLTTLDYSEHARVLYSFDPQPPSPGDQGTTRTSAQLAGQISLDHPVDLDSPLAHESLSSVAILFGEQYNPNAADRDGQKSPRLVARKRGTRGKGRKIRKRTESTCSSHLAVAVSTIDLVPTNVATYVAAPRSIQTQTSAVYLGPTAYLTGIDISELSTGRAGSAPIYPIDAVFNDTRDSACGDVSPLANHESLNQHEDPGADRTRENRSDNFALMPTRHNEVAAIPVGAQVGRLNPFATRAVIESRALPEPTPEIARWWKDFHLHSPNRVRRSMPRKGTPAPVALSVGRSDSCAPAASEPLTPTLSLSTSTSNWTRRLSTTSTAGSQSSICSHDSWTKPGCARSACNFLYSMECTS